MIHFRNATRGSGLDSRTLKRTARALLHALGEEDAALSLSLVNDQAIRAINRRHRGKDAPTDVLSFPMHDGDERNDAPQVNEPERLLGDVVISVETARRQADAYDGTLESEVNRLLIHGVLHLLGHDHEHPAERARMTAEERRLAACIGMRWPY